MESINLNNKTFLLVENAAAGTVNSDTIFKYQQRGNLITADYQGGTIKHGKIIAKLAGDQLDMLYQCMTTEDQLKAGKAVAQISRAPNGKIKLSLNWEWLGDHEGSGTSEYIES